MKTFTYNPSSPFQGKLSSLGIALFMIVFPLFFPFGLRLGRMRILSPGVFSAILIIGGILLLIFTLLEIRKARILLAKGGGTITVDENKVTYPEVAKGELKEAAFLISDIESVKYDEEENECEVKTADDHIVFHVNYFENWEAYQEFRTLLGKE